MDMQPELELGFEFPATEVNLVDLVGDLVSELDGDEVTPYQVHSVINKALEALGSEYRVRPQMMYNYATNGLIVKGTKGLKRFTHQQVCDFVVRFVNRNVSK